MVDRIFGGAIERLARGLGYAAHRHAVLVQNLANVETPGYRARDVAFEDHLGPRLTPAPELPPPLPPVGGRRPQLVLAEDGPARRDGNDVHLDRQMARLAENTLFHGPRRAHAGAREPAQRPQAGHLRPGAMEARWISSAPSR